MPNKATEVGATSMRLELNGKPFRQQLEQEGKRAERQASGIATKIGKVFAAAMSVKAVTAFAKKCLDLGSDLAEVQNVVDVTFTSMNKKVDEFAELAAMQFGLSETMAKQFTGTFGAMAKAFGFAESDVYEMSTALTGLAGDVASFYNLDQEEAFSKLKAIFTGETEGLKSLGVVMTHSALDAFAMANGFGKTTSAMNEQEKVALRYRFVLDKLSGASGDFARTSTGWANQVRILKLQFESLCATIGQGLIAALSPALQALNKFMGALIKAANTFKSFVYSLFGQNSEDMQAGAGATTSALGEIADGAGAAADGLGDVGDAAGGAASDAADAAKKIQRSLAGFDQITKLTEAADSSSGGSGGSSGSGGAGAGGAGDLGDTASALQNTAYEVSEDGGPFDKLFEKLKKIKDLFMGGFWEGLGDVSVFDEITEHVQNISGALEQIFGSENSKKAFSDWLDSLVTSFGKISGAAVSIAATVVDNLLGGMDSWLTKHGPEIEKWWQDLLGSWTNINEKAGELAEAIADIFTVFRSDDAKSASGSIISLIWTPISNVVLLLTEFKETFLENIVKVISDNKEKIKTALDGSIGRISSILETIDDTVTSVWESVQRIWNQHVKPLLDSFGNGVSEIVGTILDGWNNHVSPVLDKLTEKFKDVVEDHVKPVLEKLEPIIGTIFDGVKALWEKVLQPMRNDLAEKIMPVIADIIELLGEDFLDKISGIADGLGLIIDAFTSISEGSADIIKSFETSWDQISLYVTDVIGRGLKQKFIDIGNSVISVVNGMLDNITGTLKNSSLGSWITEQLGVDLDTIHIPMIADLDPPPGKKYEEYKKKIEEDSKKKPVATNGTVNATGFADKIAASKKVTTGWTAQHNNQTRSWKRGTSWTTTGWVAQHNTQTRAWKRGTSWTTSGWTAKFTNVDQSGLKASQKKINVTANITGTSRGSWRLVPKAEGGVFRNGRWSPIQAFAQGGLPANGQLFAAREAGPELVGTLGGHTAVMNNDQIVASVSAGVARAIAGIKLYCTDRYTPRLAEIGSSVSRDTSELTELAKQAVTASAGGNMAQVVILLRSILEVLRNLDFDVKMDGVSVKDRIVQLINANTQATGICEIVV